MIYGFRRFTLGLWPAALAAGAWVLQPNLFGHGHYAAYDAVLTCALGPVDRRILPGRHSPSDRRQRSRRPHSVGLDSGLRPGSRLRGRDQVHGLVLAVAVPDLVVLLSQSARVQELLLGGFIAIVVLFALMPPWWHDPVNGVIRFLESNLSRGKTIPIQIAVSRHGLQHARRVAPVVQHAGLDGLRDPGRILDHGGDWAWRAR